MPAVASSPYPSITNEHVFGTWLIPVCIFGSLLCVAIIAFVWLFYVYGCFCLRQSKEMSTPLPKKKVPARTVQARQIMLLPQQDCPILHAPQDQQYMHVYRDSPHEYAYHDFCPEDYQPSLYDVDLQPVPSQQIYPQPTHAYDYEYSQSHYAFQGAQHPHTRPQPLVYHTPPRLQNHLSPSPPSPSPLRGPLCSIARLHQTDYERSFHQAYDDYSTPTLISPESPSSCYSDGTSIGRDTSFSSEGHSAELPLLKFTPPSVKDLASFALAPVGSLDDLLQSANVDTSRSVPQSRSFPVPPGQKQRSRKNRAMAIIGSDLVIGGAGLPSEEEILPVRASGDVHNMELKKRRHRAYDVHALREILKENQVALSAQMMRDNNESKRTKRKSMIVKVWSPSTGDLCQFGVSRNESLEEFKERIRQKLGMDIGLFVKEEMIATEQDWSHLPQGSMVTARPI